MFSNAGTLLDRLQGLFSKGFLVGGVVPLVMLFFVNWGCLYYFFPEVYHSWSSDLFSEPKQEIWYWIKIILIIFVGSLIIWNINPLLRQFWEGRFLPSWIQKSMKVAKDEKFMGLRKDQKELELTLDDYRNATNKWKLKLRDARNEVKPRSDASALDEIDTLLRELERKYKSFQGITFKEITPVFELLLGKLSEKKMNDTLDKLHVRFNNLLDETLSYYEKKYDQFLIDFKQRFPKDRGRVGPTTMANISEIHRDYGYIRFGLDVEFFWVRLLKVIRGDSDFYPMLEEAKNQLDFGIALASVLGFTTILWIPLSLFANGVIPFLLVGILGPFFTLIAYRVAVQSYRGFSEVVQSAIDLNRFKLLELLHIALPPDSKTEKDLWHSIADGEDISYSHNSSEPEPGDPPPKPGFFQRLKNLFNFS